MSGTGKRVELRAQAADQKGQPGEILLSFTVYPTWSTACVTADQAREFAAVLLALADEVSPVPLAKCDQHGCEFNRDRGCKRCQEHGGPNAGRF